MFSSIVFILAMADTEYICYLYSEYIFIIGIEIVCRENGNERECTKLDFLLHEKYKNYLCSSSTGNGSFQ